jgi:hypothetical protein
MYQSFDEERSLAIVVGPEQAVQAEAMHSMRFTMAWLELQGRMGQNNCREPKKNTSRPKLLA